MPRRILVTGAGGFIGAALVRRLARTPDTRVTALIRRGQPAAAGPIEWLDAGLEQLQPSTWAGRERAFDVVLHLAAFTPKRGSERDRADDIISANIVGTQRLLSSLPQPPGRVVFCSTLDVYARAAFAQVVDERSELGPDSLYGASKLFGERLVDAWARAAGCEHVTLRIGHVYGPGEDRYAKLVPETIRRVLASQPPRMVGAGDERRDLLYVDDAAEALARACDAPLGPVRTINIARGESYAIRDIVEIILRLTGSDGSIEALPSGGNVYSTRFDPSLMTQVLGTWEHVPLAEGLGREIDFFRQLGR